MAFTRKTYTGPVKNRGTIARGGKKLADVSKEELDAFRKKAGNEDLSYKEALRKLLNADRNAKPKDKPKPDAAKPMPKSEFTDLLDRNNPASKYIKKMPDNRPFLKDAAFDDKGVTARKSPEAKTMPNNNPSAEGAKFGDPGAPKRASPEMIKTSDKKDDTSLSVSERIENARERVRTSDTGTDKRSVSDRLKSAFGMAAGPGASVARSAGRVAEEAKKEKGMKKGGMVKKGRDGLAQRGKTKGRMC